MIVYFVESEIDEVIKYLKEDGTSYNWKQQKLESETEFLVIDIKKLDDCGFQFYKYGLICKVLESIVVEECNGFPTPKKSEAHLGN